MRRHYSTLWVCVLSAVFSSCQTGTSPPEGTEKDIYGLWALTSYDYQKLYKCQKTATIYRVLEVSASSVTEYGPSASSSYWSEVRTTSVAPDGFAYQYSDNIGGIAYYTTATGRFDGQNLTVSNDIQWLDTSGNHLAEEADYYEEYAGSIPPSEW